MNSSRLKNIIIAILALTNACLLVLLLSRRAQELGPIIYHPDMVVTHLWKRDNVHSAKGRRQQIRSIIKFFHKWGVAW